MPHDIGKTLKKCRNDANMSVKAISDLLTKKGFKASESTIYSWENGNSQPTPGALLTMCEAYNVDDILTTFGYDGYNEDGTLRLDMYEIDIIEKYRTLDSFGQETVSYILDREVQRMEQLKEDRPDITIAQQDMRVIRYYQRMASAGTGQVVFEDMPTERIQIPDIPEYRCVSYAIGVNGDSMEPLYYDGDILLVETTLQIEIGEIGIFIVDGEAFVKQLGEGKLISLNEKYKDIPLTEYSNCMGRVVGKLEMQ